MAIHSSRTHSSHKCTTQVPSDCSKKSTVKEDEMKLRSAPSATPETMRKVGGRCDGYSAGISSWSTTCISAFLLFTPFTSSRTAPFGNVMPSTTLFSSEPITHASSPKMAWSTTRSSSCAVAFSSKAAASSPAASSLAMRTRAPSSNSCDCCSILLCCPTALALLCSSSSRCAIFCAFFASISRARLASASALRVCASCVSVSISACLSSARSSTFCSKSFAVSGTPFAAGAAEASAPPFFLSSSFFAGFSTRSPKRSSTRSLSPFHPPPESSAKSRVAIDSEILRSVSASAAATASSSTFCMP
mmetsp:Transcript_13445/g.28993  ORF Transcript_13445/g.28993 Transcript_13445/m.28993 type:complete len:304 (+) Transcript_13445:249-1160(+)